MAGWDDFPDAPKGGGLVINMTKAPPAMGNDDAWGQFPDAPHQRSDGEKAARFVGQVAQNFNDSFLPTVIGAPVDLVAAGLRKIGVPVTDPYGGSESIKRVNDWLASVPGKLGLTTEGAPVRFDPETTAEKTAAGIGQGTGMVASTILPASGIARIATPGTTTQRIAELLAGQPVAQATMGAAGGAVTGATDNPYLGLATTLAVPTVSSALGGAKRLIGGIISPDTEEAVRRTLSRALERDNTTGIAMGERQAELGPGALAVEAGGPNIRGVLRGSIAAPGQGRTAAQEAFDARIGGSNARTGTALDNAVSPNGSLATTVDELSALRAQQAAPAYEASGIPRTVEMTETARPGEPMPTKMVPILPGARAMTRVEEFGPPQPIIDRTFNTPNVTSPDLEFLLKYSPDVQAAIGAARRLPQFKDLPSNSMVMLDKAYKHLSGMEQEAIRAGNNTRAFDLKNLRQQFQNALTNANPQYQTALDAFSGPSKLIDAAERAREWFTKNVDPSVVRREFQDMSPDQQEAARVGLRDWARTMIGRSDRGVAAERVWSGGSNRDRFEAILGKDEFDALKKAMDVEKNAISTSRDINVGSRTVPMGAETQDNAQQAVGPLADLLRGRIGMAASKIGGRAYERLVEGRTEAVNQRLADILTSADPEVFKAMWRTGVLPPQSEPGLAALLGAQTLRSGAELESGDRRTLARALMNGNERRLGAAR